MSFYNYSLSTDFPAPHQVSVTQLIARIHLSSITDPLYDVAVDGDTVSLGFINPLSDPEKTTLDGIIAAHVPEPEIYNNRALIRDEKASGTSGGNLTLGTWKTRDLNTIYGHNVWMFVTLASNTFILQPGNYLIHARSESSGIGANQIRVWDVTNSQAKLYGDTTAGNTAHLEGVLEVTDVTAYAIQLFANTQVINLVVDGLGAALGGDGPEVYTTLLIEGM